MTPVPPPEMNRVSPFSMLLQTATRMCLFLLSQAFFHGFMKYFSFENKEKI